MLYPLTTFAPPVEGERFSFRVTDASGAVVTERAGPATYSDFYPNGITCAGTCRRGSLP